MTENEMKLIELLSKVLAVDELNTNEMEDNTRKVVQEASLYLANKYNR